MSALFASAAALFTLCTAAPRETCVVDGDTFWLNGEKVRIADINAPETHKMTDAVSVGLLWVVVARLLERIK